MTTEERYFDRVETEVEEFKAVICLLSNRAGVVCSASSCVEGVDEAKGCSLR
jgi:hypothetical protein